jgi:hypothetical protein
LWKLTGLESNQRTRDPKSRCPCQQSTGHREPSPGVEPSRPAIQRTAGPTSGGRGRHAARRELGVEQICRGLAVDQAAAWPCALGGIRTLTTSRPQTPQACASTSSATSACEPQRGFEPRTPPLREACSGQLSYRGKADDPGFEPGQCVTVSRSRAGRVASYTSRHRVWLRQL